ncbi:MAG TPA: ABC transporter ATP-binding protein [Terriglobales bacterium]
MIATMQAEVDQMMAQEVEGPIVASLSRVSKKFESLTALDDIDFDIHAGELVALLGPNGAGKTTAVKLLLGLAHPTAGAVSVFGGNPVNAEVRARTGAMLQVAKVPETLRVREHIELFSSYYPAPLPLAETLAVGGLEEIRDREFGELSGGQKQRVLFALALCGDPDLIFLDEPTVGMDVEARRTLWQQIRKLIARGKTVLLTTHYLEEADALADRIVVINRGRIIAEGTPAEIKNRTSGQRIRCRSELTIDVLRDFPAVTEVTKTGPWFEIRTTAAESVLRELLLRDPAVSGIEVTTAGLEEAFLSLTSNETNNK